MRDDGGDDFRGEREHGGHCRIICGCNVFDEFKCKEYDVDEDGEMDERWMIWLGLGNDKAGLAVKG